MDKYLKKHDSEKEKEDSGNNNNTEHVSVPVILNGKYFEIVGNGEDDKVKAKCLMCETSGKETIISGCLRATTNFKLHMKRLHKSALVEFDQYKVEMKVKGARQKRRTESEETGPKLKQLKLSDISGNQTLISKQKQFEENVVRYIVNSMKPLSTVEDPNFRTIFTDLDSNLNIMSRRTLSRKIDVYFENTMMNLKDIFSNIKYVSTTADIWSTKHKSFIGVTAHWVDSNLKRRSSVLDCRRFKGTHSYDRIAEILSDIFSDYNLRHEQLVSTITDNGSNFVKAFAEFGVPLKILDEVEDDLDQETNTTQMETDNEDFDFLNIIDDDESHLKCSIVLPNHLRCASHTLNLLATTDFNKLIKGNPVTRLHHPAFAKCTALWNLARKPKSSEIINNVLGCSLLYPCPTRWNSLFDATNQLVKYRSMLNNLNSKLNLKDFKDAELEYLTEFCVVMKPIAAALDNLQRENDCYYGQLLPTLLSLRQRLRNLQEQNLRHTGFMINGLLNSLERRFIKFFELSPEVNESILASCFHPTFKLRWLPEELEPERQRIQNLCINAMEAGVGIEELQEQASSTSETEEEFFVFTSPKIEKRQSNTELELVTFFNDKNKSLDSLNKYPLVRQMFIRFNTSLCSSAPVERLFSFAGFIYSPTRGSLSDSTFRKLLFLKGNTDFCKFS